MIRGLAAALVLALSLACVPLVRASFAKGADMSWSDQEEASGYTFHTRAGVKADCFALMKSEGVNAVRLRVWVNPSGGWCNGADTLYKAQRAAAQGMSILIDFHYSDTWADPSHQTVPAAWSGHTLSQLVTDVYSHTYGILNYLKSNGITVTWVQVGNEINSGMLWPLGSTSNFGNLVQLINSGYNATKAVYPNAKVILHLANGYNDADFRWFFDNMKSHGAKYDVIGMSHYPAPASWQTTNAEAAATMNDMVSRYGKSVMVCEVGMDWQQAATAKAMLQDLIGKVSALGSKGLGVFYWEPDAFPGWQGYTLGAVDTNGAPTIALDAFL
ncbi:arabinogalactan endo-1,4-beta-galactosidase precursor [mine drainage metagenome]|uniref:arabinogalactan endo-beta-1,4-galactanase n=1 Tax=mine drainage metagenome TaxID=410659 RepID=A0A1J5SA28_9ZZZZ